MTFPSGSVVRISLKLKQGSTQNPRTGRVSTERGKSIKLADFLFPFVSTDKSTGQDTSLLVLGIRRGEDVGLL